MKLRLITTWLFLGAIMGLNTISATTTPVQITPESLKPGGANAAYAMILDNDVMHSSPKFGNQYLTIDQTAKTISLKGNSEGAYLTPQWQGTKIKFLCPNIGQYLSLDPSSKKLSLSATATLFNVYKQDGTNTIALSSSGGTYLNTNLVEDSATPVPIALSFYYPPITVNSKNLVRGSTVQFNISAQPAIAATSAVAAVAAIGSTPAVAAVDAQPAVPALPNSFLARKSDGGILQQDATITTGTWWVITGPNGEVDGNPVRFEDRIALRSYDDPSKFLCANSDRSRPLTQDAFTSDSNINMFKLCRMGSSKLGLRAVRNGTYQGAYASAGGIVAGIESSPAGATRNDKGTANNVWQIIVAANDPVSSGNSIYTQNSNGTTIAFVAPGGTSNTLSLNNGILTVAPASAASSLTMVLDSTNGNYLNVATVGTTAVPGGKLYFEQKLNGLTIDSLGFFLKVNEVTPRYVTKGADGTLSLGAKDLNSGLFVLLKATQINAIASGVAIYNFKTKNANFGLQLSTDATKFLNTDNSISTADTTKSKLANSLTTDGSFYVIKVGSPLTEYFFEGTGTANQYKLRSYDQKYLQPDITMNTSSTTAAIFNAVADITAAAVTAATSTITSLNTNLASTTSALATANTNLASTTSALTTATTNLDLTNRRNVVNPLLAAAKAMADSLPNSNTNKAQLVTDIVAAQTATTNATNAAGIMADAAVTALTTRANTARAAVVTDLLTQANTIIARLPDTFADKAPLTARYNTALAGLATTTSIPAASDLLDEAQESDALNTAQQNIARLNRNSADLAQQLADAQKAIDKAKKDGDAAVSAAQNKSAAEKQAAADAAAQALQAAKDEAARIQADDDANKAALAQKQADLASLQAVLAGTQDALKASQDAQVAEQKAATEALKVQQDAQKTELAARDKEMTELRAQFAAYIAKMQPTKTPVQVTQHVDAVIAGDAVAIKASGPAAAPIIANVQQATQAAVMASAGLGAEVAPDGGVIGIAAGGSAVYSINNMGLYKFMDTAAANAWQQQPLKLVDTKKQPVTLTDKNNLDALACGIDDTLGLLDDAGTAYIFNAASKSFEALPAPVKFSSLAIGNRAQIWAVDTTGNLYQHTTKDWQLRLKADGKVHTIDVAVGGDGSVVRVDKSGDAFMRIFKASTPAPVKGKDGKVIKPAAAKPGQQVEMWVVMPKLPNNGDLEQLALGSQREIIATTTDGRIARLGTKGWELLGKAGGPKVLDVAINGAGSIVALDATHSVWMKPFVGAQAQVKVNVKNKKTKQVTSVNRPAAGAHLTQAKPADIIITAKKVGNNVRAQAKNAKKVDVKATKKIQTAKAKPVAPKVTRKKQVKQAAKATKPAAAHPAKPAVPTKVATKPATKK